MFERYTERARRAIFFGRFEASTFGSKHIDTEHLLLGLMREDPQLKREISARGATYDTIRAKVEAQSPPGESIPTSVDLPLSHEAKRALSYAAEESERLDHKIIAPGHLVLGLLRGEGSVAAALLEECGIKLPIYRELVRKTPSEPGEPPQVVVRYVPAEAEPAPAPPKASQLAAPIAALISLEELEIKPLYPDQRLKRKPWTRREAMGRLIDLATAHHQWLARALTEPKLTAAVYPQEEWVTAQQYVDYPWPDLVDLWIALNQLVCHVLCVIPQEKLNMECRIGVEEPQTLVTVIQRYVHECEDLVGQILALL